MEVQCLKLLCFCLFASLCDGNVENLFLESKQQENVDSLSEQVKKSDDVHVPENTRTTNASLTDDVTGSDDVDDDEDELDDVTEYWPAYNAEEHSCPQLSDHFIHHTPVRNRAIALPVYHKSRFLTLFENF